MGVRNALDMPLQGALYKHMTATKLSTQYTRDPLLALAMGDVAGVLALVIRTEGPSYRSVGAAMVFADDGARLGSLSSGCIEADLALHAEKAKADGTCLRVIYGHGSPFIDIQLPCGGGLEILLLPQPAPDALALISQVVTDRRTVNLSISLSTGHITEGKPVGTALAGDSFTLEITPPLRFAVFGKGPEAATFARLVQSLGYNGALISPDPETLAIPLMDGWSMHQIHQPVCPTAIALDKRTAVLFFFHDHEWEAPILSGILGQDTFYIGCQGSKQTSLNRLDELAMLNVPADQREKVRGPIGLISSARDSSTLAVSVLAEILATPG